jgi:hypothetical protein
MSDNSTSIVPKLTNYPDRLSKAKSIVEWLVSIDAVEPVKTDCILSESFGYPIGKSAKALVDEPEYLPYGLIVCGLEVTTKNTVFHAGANGLDSFVCPSCGGDILGEEWDFNDFNEGGNSDLICPLCNWSADLNDYDIEPAWGFSNLGFTFWNWPPLKDSVIAEFEQRLGCEVRIVNCHI